MAKKQTTMMDAQGNEVLLKYVTAYDKKRDRLARRCLARWIKAREALVKCYAETAADIEEMEVEAGTIKDGRRGVKGNFQFQSFDGLITVARSARYELHFDERLRVAQEMIEKIIEEKAEGIDTDLAELVRGVFRPTSDGLLSQARVMGLFRLRITHKLWAEAMDLIRASIESKRGKNLLSVREKKTRDSEWQSLLLTIADAAGEEENDEC